MNRPSDWREAVTRLAASDDPTEIAALVEKLRLEFKRPVWATALRLSRGDESLAADIFQETFVHLIESRRHIRSPIAFPRFLKVTTMNIGRDMLRRRATAERHASMSAAEEASTGDLLSTRLYLQAYLDKLDPIQVEVLRSKFFLGEDDQQAATRLGKSPENIRVIRHRGLARLRQMMEAEELSVG